MTKRTKSENRKGLVSIIVPCYNYAHYLPEALDSVLQQDYEEWECIIVDDGSTDSTRRVALNYCNSDTRFKLIEQENLGLSAARNVGLINARGSFIQLLDADDLISQHKLSCQIEFLSENPKVDIVYGDIEYFSPEGPSDRSVPDSSWMPKVNGTRNCILPRLVIANITVVSSPLIRRRVFDDVSGFNESLSSYEDWHFFIRCALNNKLFTFCSRCGVVTSIRWHSTSMSKQTENMLRNALAIRAEIQSSLPAGMVRFSNLIRFIRDSVKLTAQSWHLSKSSALRSLISKDTARLAWSCLKR